MSYAHLVICGNLGNDPETKQVGVGSLVSFSVGITKKKKGEESTTWIRCSAWEKTGSMIAEYFKKGDPIICDGELDVREYVSRDGVKQKSIELRVNSFSFLPKKSGGGGGYKRDGYASNERQAPAPAQKESAFGDDYDDEIGF